MKTKTDLTRPGYRQSEKPTRQDTRQGAQLISDRPNKMVVPEVGACVGRYRLLAELGTGGMGVVFEALDPELDRKVAIKLLRPPFDKTQLVREARALARLSHPNVVTIHDVGEADGRTFIAMELIHGMTLRRWLGERERSLHELFDVLVPAGRGLAAAHAAQLVHRDFKPENVMVGHDGRVRVLDFGIVSAVAAHASHPPGPRTSADSTLTVSFLDSAPVRESSGFAGTPAYMAPEQLSEQAIDERADQFSFCVVLWEAVYGERPFQSARLSDRANGISSTSPPAPTAGVPLWLHRLLLRGLSGNLAARHASMEVLLDALEAGLAREQAAARWVGRRYEPIKTTAAIPAGLERALDRLTGKVVTLQRVVFSNGSERDSTPARIQLASVFRDLASLRHPNLVGVLDFGFENEGGRYVVLDLGDAGVDLRAATRDQREGPVLDYVVQILRALSHLHRHRMLIGEIALDDVFVIEHQVKLLPLRMITSGDGARPGHRAPELASGATASVTADLYALGLLSLEMFGARPAPELSSLDLEPNIQPVFKRLLAADPAARYQSADEVIDALAQALGRELATETFQTRESRLRAAPLLGREAEVERLGLAVEAVCRGAGGAWLICGESGVGKSRLIDEVRTLGLVQGALVLRGQEESEGGSPYRLFRDALRWLALITDLDDLEAGVLLQIVPDLPHVLNRPVTPAPELDSFSMHARTCDVVTSILRRQKQPVIVLLEDLHWSRSDSLELLKRIIPIASELPLLVVATDRNDERPGQRDALTGMQTLQLQRLSQGAVENLLVAMIGEAARRPEVVRLLWRETEGNAFFLVEVVRVLAEESGGMARIGAGSLPAKVFAGGIRRAVERRLQRVPQEARPLLRIAAVIGRTIDKGLLAAIAPDVDLEPWAAQCIEASVLELTSEGTRFAHDKLREGLIAEIAGDEHRRLSHVVAEAIERESTRGAERYALLAYHFGKAEDRAKEALYAALSGEQALRSFAIAEGIVLLQRALELTEETSATAQRRARLHRLLGEAYFQEGRFDQALSHLTCTLSRLGIAVPVSRFHWVLLLLRQVLLQALLYTGIIRLRRVDKSVAEDANEVSWAAARAAGIYSYDMDMLRSLTLSLISVNQVRRGAQENPFGLGVLGYVCESVRVGAGRTYFRRARRGAVSSPDNQRALADVMHLQASCWISVGRLDNAERVALESITVAEEIGDRNAASVGQNLVEVCDHLRGRFPRVLITARNVEAYCAGEHKVLRLCSLGLALSELGQADRALALLSVRPGQQTPQLRVSRATLLGVTALAHARHGALPAAWATVQECLQIGVAGALVPASCSVILTGPMVATLKCWSRAIDSAPSEVAEYERTARRILRQLRAYGRVSAPGAMIARYFDGHVRALCGNRSGALRAWSRAVETADKLGMDYYQGLAHLELGRANPAARLEHFERAAVLLSACGIENYEVASDGAATTTRRRALES